MNSSAAPSAVPTVVPLPRALPAWAYNHPEMTRLEYERILKPSWQIVCHASSIPKPGDYVTLDLGADSVVAVRSAKGEIQAFHNVCRHRGSRLLEGTAPISPAPITDGPTGSPASWSACPLARPSRDSIARNSASNRCARRSCWASCSSA